MNLLLDEIALAAARLAEAGVESPRAEAELIAAHVHGVRRTELHAVPDSAFDARFWEGVGRRAAREPLQHITGRAYFRYLELEVGPGVFVPRPETEVMTGWAIDRLREMDVAEPVVVDLGTGSGAIALAHRPGSPAGSRARRGSRPDRACLDGAQRRALAVAAPYTEGRVSLYGADFTGGLAAVEPGTGELGELDGKVDLVISNPPYIPLGASVPPEVGEYDPPAALWSGAGRPRRDPRRRARRPAAAAPGWAGRGGARRAPGCGRVLGVLRGSRLA